MLYEEWWAANQLKATDLPIDEGWVSDVAHFVGDVSAAVADVVVPGSGAVIDVINMLSYFAEASFSKDDLEKTKLVLSGLIQAFAIFEPLNAVTTLLKNSLSRVFSAFAAKTPAAIATARIAAREVETGLTTMLNRLTGIATRILTALSDSKFGQAIAWLSNRLGITNVLVWIKNFITQTAVPFIKNFLTRIRDTFNPNQAGASTPSGEFNSVLARNIAKLAVDQKIASAIHDKVLTFATDWRKGLSYAQPFIVHQQDNTYVDRSHIIPAKFR